MYSYWAFLIGTPLFSSLVLFYIAYTLKTRVFVYTGVISATILLQLYFYSMMESTYFDPQFARIHLIFLSIELFIVYLMCHDQQLTRNRLFFQTPSMVIEITLKLELFIAVAITLVFWFIPATIAVTRAVLLPIVFSAYATTNFIVVITSIQILPDSDENFKLILVNVGFFVLCISSLFGIAVHALNNATLYLRIHLFCIASAPLFFASQAIFTLNKLKKGDYIARLQLLALIDPLTKTFNRNAFVQHFNLLRKKNRNERLYFALLYVDIDNFKQINDSYGHNYGDQVLHIFARRVQNALRAGDKLYRIGGDEFIVYIHLTVHAFRPLIDSITQRILRACTRPYSVLGSTFRLGCSIGVTVYPFDEISIKEMVLYSDIAALTAKKLPSTPIMYYSELPQQ